MRRRLKLGALTAAVALAAGCAAGQAYRKGKAASKAGDLDQAVAYYRKFGVQGGYTHLKIEENK